MLRFGVVGLLCLLQSRLVLADAVAVIGKIPGEYLNKTETQSHLGVIRMKDRLIQEIAPLRSEDVQPTVRRLQAKGTKVILLKPKGSHQYDVIYPALIDLHGHNKQNVLPTWGKAKGQFANRFEWRKRVANYKQVQSQNMNPWSSKSGAKIAAYRWSELQAMVLGTGYLQGAIQNHKGFSIHSVEDPGAYKSKRRGVSSPGDIIDPQRVHFLWNELRPEIERLGCLGKEKCYGRAVKVYLEAHCDDLPQVATKDIYDLDSVNWLLANESWLKKNCKVKDQKAFLEYFTKVFGITQHAEFIKRYHTLKHSNRSAIVTHLAEGAISDPYNWTEFQILKLGGIAIAGMSFIHGVGLREADFEYMSKNSMGLVWSPYSNFLLYGETVDIGAAKKAGVTIALGSDWTPTGSKGVLDELKLARNYVIKKGLSKKAFSDRELYYMVTKYPAQIIRHYGFERKGEHGIGTLQVGAMASLIAVKEVDSNPYTNLVKEVRAQEVNLVVIDGVPTYGNESYLQAAGVEKEKIEVISNLVFDKTLAEDGSAFPSAGASDEEVGKKASAIRLGRSQRCNFEEQKALAIAKSYDYNKKVKPYKEKTGLDLDTYSGIVRYLGIALLSQSKNAQQKNSHAVRVLPPLYGCDDQGDKNGKLLPYLDRLLGMVKENGDDESTENKSDRTVLRVNMKLYSYRSGSSWKRTLPHELAEKFSLPYTKHETTVKIKEKKQTVIVDVLLNENSSKFDSLWGTLR